MKTSELTGAALDWAVECAKGTHWSANGYFIYDLDAIPSVRYTSECAAYSTDWAQGGPIIEREKIEWRWFWPTPNDPNPICHVVWVNGVMWEINRSTGLISLIAAMRAYVASKLGDEIEIPKELMS